MFKLYNTKGSEMMVKSPSSTAASAAATMDFDMKSAGKVLTVGMLTVWASANFSHLIAPGQPWQEHRSHCRGGA